jgi:hypothetical protein
MLDNEYKSDIYQTFLSLNHVENIIDIEDRVKRETILNEKDLYWYKKLSKTVLTIQIEENIKQYSWNTVITYQNLPEDFIEKYAQDKVYYWLIVSSNQNLSEEFIDKHADKLNWTMLVTHHNLSEKLYNAMGIVLDYILRDLEDDETESFC